MKFLKLALFVLILVGAVIGISFLSNGSKGGNRRAGVGTSFNRIQADIDSLFGTNATWWNKVAFENVTSNIDNKKKNELLDAAEAKTLREHLELESCILINRTTKSLFRQSAYPADKVQQLYSAVNYIAALRKQDPRIAEAGGIIRDYYAISSFIAGDFSQDVSYSHPLRPFDMEVYDKTGFWRGNANYKTYFVNNPSIKDGLDRSDARIKEAHRQYLAQLEESIERHYTDSREPLAKLHDDRNVFFQETEKYKNKNGVELSDLDASMYAFVKNYQN